MGVRGQLVGLCIGLAIGLELDVITVRGEYPGLPAWSGISTWVTTATFVTLVLAATNWLRERPRAPLTRYVTSGLLALALCAAVLVVVLPQTWQVPMTLAAAVLVSSAVLIQAGPRITTRLLLGAIAIGLGVWLLGLEVVGLLGPADWSGYSGIWPIEAVITGCGVAFIGLGVAILGRSYVLAGVATIGAGALVGGLGVPGTLGGHVLAGVVLIGCGVVVIGFGVALFRESHQP
jgi:hypothetical protein